MKRIVILLGPPGAGKGTVGSRISESFGLPLVSSGDLLREAVQKGTGHGAKAKKFMDEGELVPDSLVIDLIKERISREDCKGGFMLDGFPRNLDQALMLEDAYEDSPDLKVIYLKADDDFLVKRLSGRRVCPECGRVYHLVNIPPARDGVCDFCGSTLVQREDDRPDVIRRRLEVYRSLTAPLLEYYRSSGVLYEVPGDVGLQGTLDAIERLF